MSLLLRAARLSRRALPEPMAKALPTLEARVEVRKAARSAAASERAAMADPTGGTTVRAWEALHALRAAASEEEEAAQDDFEFGEDKREAKVQLELASELSKGMHIPLHLCPPSPYMRP